MKNVFISIFCVCCMIVVSSSAAYANEKITHNFVLSATGSTKVTYEVDPKVAGNLVVKFTAENNYAEDYMAASSYNPIVVILYQYNNSTKTLKTLKYMHTKDSTTLTYNMPQTEIDQKEISYKVTARLNHAKVVSHGKLEISYPKAISKVKPIAPSKIKSSSPKAVKAIPRINN